MTDLPPLVTAETAQRMHTAGQDLVDAARRITAGFGFKHTSYPPVSRPARGPDGRPLPPTSIERQAQRTRREPDLLAARTAERDRSAARESLAAQVLLEALEVIRRLHTSPGDREAHARAVALLERFHLDPMTPVTTTILERPR